MATPAKHMTEEEIVSGAVERFLEKVDLTGNCWVWKAGANPPSGYGSFKFLNKSHRAHVLMYEAFFGPVPKGLELDHLCRNRRCVNPLHLEAVTRQVNVDRGNGRKGKRRVSECRHGHPYTPENTMLFPSGARWCRTCYKQLYLPKAVERMRRVRLR